MPISNLSTLKFNSGDNNSSDICRKVTRQGRNYRAVEISFSYRELLSRALDFGENLARATIPVNMIWSVHAFPGRHCVWAFGNPSLLLPLATPITHITLQTPPHKLEAPNLHVSDHGRWSLHFQTIMKAIKPQSNPLVA